MYCMQVAFIDEAELQSIQTLLISAAATWRWVNYFIVDFVASTGWVKLLCDLLTYTSALYFCCYWACFIQMLRYWYWPCTGRLFFLEREKYYKYNKSLTHLVSTKYLLSLPVHQPLSFERYKLQFGFEASVHYADNIYIRKLLDYACTFCVTLINTSSFIQNNELLLSPEECAQQWSVCYNR